MPVAPPAAAPLAQGIMLGRRNARARGWRRAALAGFAALCAALTFGCGGGGEPDLLIAAASDLRPAFEEMEPAFEARCGCRVTFSFGSSGTLTSQIEGGMPADAFFAANAAYVDDLAGKGAVLRDSVTPYAVGRIVLAAPAGGAPVSTLDDLRDARIRKIAIANPDHAPYGAAAKQALRAAGVWDDVQDRLVLAENATQATEFVDTGDAQAGIVPLSLAVGRDGLRYVLIDASLHAPLLQAAAVVARSDDAALAREFIDFVVGAEGRPIMERYGFEAPGKE